MRLQQSRGGFQKMRLYFSTVAHQKMTERPQQTQLPFQQKMRSAPGFIVRVQQNRSDFHCARAMPISPFLACNGAMSILLRAAKPLDFNLPCARAKRVATVFEKRCDPRQAPLCACNKTAATLIVRVQRPFHPFWPAMAPCAF